MIQFLQLIDNQKFYYLFQNHKEPMDKLYKNSLVQDLQQADKTLFNNPRICKSSTHKNNLSMGSSLRQMNKLMCMFTNKQKEEFVNTKKGIRKSFIQYVHQSLLKYSKKKNNIDELMEQKNKELDSLEAQQIDLKPIFLQRKYNIPLSIKYSVIKESQQIIENKNKVNEKEKSILLSVQPLVKKIKRMTSDHKNKSKQNYSHLFQPLGNLNQENFENYIPRNKRNTSKYYESKSYYKNEEKKFLAQSEGLKPGCLKGLSKINRKKLKLNSILNMSFEHSNNSSVDRKVLRNQYIRNNL